MDDWFLYAPPKMGELHWKDGRSAKELAKAFFATGTPVVPPELLDLLASSDELGEVRFTEAWPERKIQLDSYFGETRNADLAAISISAIGKIAVTVEAKADESFGRLIAEELSAASATSKLPARIAALCSSVLGRPPAGVGNLRYQLLHGIAGTLIFAKERNAVAAVFIVYEFNGPSCLSRNLERNAGDLASFLSVLSSSRSLLRQGKSQVRFMYPVMHRFIQHSAVCWKGHTPYLLKLRRRESF
ncbi:MAG: hypothetical protein IPK16_08640 [Anaerolineales bacterium]|nr:hypothetical protein [Anaerolineales bacterium]